MLDQLLHHSHTILKLVDHSSVFWSQFFAVVQDHFTWAPMCIAAMVLIGRNNEFTRAATTLAMFCVAVLASFFTADSMPTFAMLIVLTLLVRCWTLSLTLLVQALLYASSFWFLHTLSPYRILTCSMVGAVISAITYTMWWILFCRRASQRMFYATSAYTSTGYLFRDSHLVILVFALTVIYAVFRGTLVLTI